MLKDGNPAARYQDDHRAHWDSVARKMDSWASRGAYYQERLREIYQFLVAPGQRVLEIGCATGNLLAALKPAFGVGVDLSGEMVQRAAQQHSDLYFIQCDAHDLYLDQAFDVIVLSDLVNDLWDVQSVFRQIARLTTPRTRIIINAYSRLWELPLMLAKKLDLATPLLTQNWLTVEDISALLNLEDFEVIRHWSELLWPFRTPALTTFLNRFVAKIWPCNHLNLTNFIIARPRPTTRPRVREPLVSVIIPARNEAGNIPQIFVRTPEMGRGTELVFVEGHSKDDTYSVIEREISNHPSRRSKLFRQSGMGKGDAVRLGFARASGDILMILDADLTVPPEDLLRFYEALFSGKGDFVNGVRLVYPMEERAMRYLNLSGNKFFSLVFSWLLGQPVKDTLCGTKVLWKDDYDLIAANRAHFGDFDPFGDFDLLFGAAKLNHKIVDLPIRYRERTYGTTNIQRWKHGWLLLRMVFFAMRRVKFV
ncbi:MAG: bifunctional class I SAM-dependent methyltransferase/glycosyltransferase family 2 protein [Deltaproteobacteria bacterium]|nr:bifunctional class I SAM-dependent methyltransferase/glycosyltransferase family 2 protein [Deltaproteobacteria bacterium]